MGRGYFPRFYCGDFVSSDNCFELSKGEEKIIGIKKSDITKNGEVTAVQSSDFSSLPGPGTCGPAVDTHHTFYINRPYK